MSVGGGSVTAKHRSVSNPHSGNGTAQNHRYLGIERTHGPVVRWRQDAEGFGMTMMRACVTRGSDWLRRGLALGGFAALAIGTGGAPSAHAFGFGDNGALDALRIGGTVIVRPTYEGSDEYEVTGFPIIIPEFAGGDGKFGGFVRRWIDPNGIDDIRLKLLQTDVITAGPLVGYSFGRDEDDGDLLAGLGDVDDGVVVGGFVRVSLIDSFFAEVSYHRQVSGDVDGGEARFGLGAERAVAPGVVLRGLVGASYADDEYMDAYFSVTPGQAATSSVGLPAFDADAGLKSAFVEVGAEVALGAAWTLQPSLRYSQLLEDAADSPVTADEAQFIGRLGVTYRTNFR